MTDHAIGALAALASAFLWAVSALLFRRIGDHVPPLGINLGKGLIAIALLGALSLPGGLALGDYDHLLVLAASGLVGIALGDSLYFMALVRLGPRVTLLLGTLIPVTTALLGVALLGERVAPLGWLGLGLTLAGVAYVLWQRAPGDHGNTHRWGSGLAFGIAFILAEAAGILMTKVGVAGIGAMEATFVRTVFAVAGLTFWGLAMGSFGQWTTPLRDRKTLGRLAVAAFIGAFLGTWLAVAALKYTHAAVAATLNSTSPLFILPLAAVFLRERISARAFAGAMLAVAGIGVYFAVLPVE